MKKLNLSLSIAAALALSSGAFAAVSAPTVIYGDDNRIETYQADRFSQELASAAAGMLPNRDALVIGDYTIMPPSPLNDSYGLCPGERFGDQANPMLCSGFLVGPDLLVTAGHCIRTQEDCEQMSWVFDYKVDPATGRAPVMMANKNIYKCSRVIESALEATADGKRLDYALVRLERKATDRKPLKVRTFGAVAMGEELTIIGHPSGLPQKVAGGARVVENSQENYFRANLDAFGGNSGSPVINERTGVVEGILVRGATDYDRNENGCVSPHRTSDNVTNFSRYGESVSRITDIKSLRFLNLLKTNYGE